MKPVDQFELVVRSNLKGGSTEHHATINTDDLVFVMTQWRHSAQSADECLKAVEASVRIDDMLAIINSWGVCP